MPSRSARGRKVGLLQWVALPGLWLGSQALAQELLIEHVTVVSPESPDALPNAAVTLREGRIDVTPILSSRTV